MTNLAQSYIKVDSDTERFHRKFLLAGACNSSANRRFSALSYLFSTMSRLYLYVILDHGYLLLE